MHKSDDPRRAEHDENQGALQKELDKILADKRLTWAEKHEKVMEALRAPRERKESA